MARSLLAVLLVGWIVPTVSLSLTGVVQHLLELEDEVELYMSKETQLRTSDEVFRRLRTLGSAHLFFGMPPNLPRASWMSTHYATDDAPRTTREVLETADAWACARFADAVLLAVESENGRRWLTSPEYDGEEGVAQLNADVHDAIERLNEKTIVEILLQHGFDNTRALDKYYRLFNQCIMRKLPTI